MNRIAAILSPRSPVSPVLWYAVLGAPSAWALQFWIGYWVAEARCGRPGAHVDADVSTWAIVVGAAGLAVAIGALATAIALFRSTAGAETKGPPPDGRIKFLAVVGMAVSPLFIALIAMTSSGVLIMVPCAQAQPPAGIVHQPGGAARGMRNLGAGLFAANCASCHGSRGEGVAEPNPRGAGGITGQGPPLRGVGELAPDFYLRTGRMPIEHAGEQPERGPPQFNDREIRALVAYVASFGGGPRIPRPRPARHHLSEGMSLFTEHCAGCHQIVGEGGFVTGAKVPVLGHADPTEIAEAVRIGPFLMPRFSKRAISDADLDKIIAYVQRSDHPADPGGFGIGHLGPVPEGMVAWFVAAVVLVGICVIIGERRRAS